MHSPTTLLTFALGLLTSLVVATRQPVFATLGGPFSLSVQDGFNVILRYHEEVKAYIPVISHTKIRLPEFELKKGNLTTENKHLPAYHPPIPLIFPPVLTPLRFGPSPPDAGAGFVVVTKTDRSSGQKILRLFNLDGPLVVRHLSEGQPIYSKTPGNIDPVEELNVVVKLINPKSDFAEYEDLYDEQQPLYASDLK